MTVKGTHNQALYSSKKICLLSTLNRWDAGRRNSMWRWRWWWWWLKRLVYILTFNRFCCFCSFKKKYNKNNNKYKKLSSKLAIGSHAFDVPSAGIFFAENSMLFFDYLLQCLTFLLICCVFPITMANIRTRHRLLSKTLEFQPPFKVLKQWRSGGE